jgi:serine/threonine protein kinase
VSIVFGKYHLIERLAEGGMAVVWRAKLLGPSGFEKTLVVKQIRAELAARREFVDLFVTEAKVTVALTHANIVPVYELGMVDGTYFLALELIDGPPLSQLIAEGPMPPQLAAYVAEQVLRGLDYAHRREVVHRDLSSANVLCSRDGEVKIVDFGIAANVDGAGIKGGSRGYMAPEQAAGVRVDARSDLYAVGVLLWEMCAGRRFDGQTVDAPKTLVEIISTATAPEPEDRYADAAAMLLKVTRYLRDADATQADLCAYVRRMAPDVPRDTDSGELLPAPVDDLDRPSGPRTAPVARAEPQHQKEVTFATRIEVQPAAAATRGRLLIGAGAIVLVGLSAYAGARMRDATAYVPLPSPPPVIRSAHLTIRSRPVEARILVDHRPIDPGGPGGIDLAPGRHVITAEAEGRRALERALELTAGEAHVEDLVLDPEVGRLAVRSDPAGADVLVGDHVVGQTPLELEVPLDTPPALRIRRRDYQPVERSLPLTAFAGSPRAATLTETLKPLPRGELTLGAKPWAQVTIDGEKRPDTPLVRQALAAGPHTIRLYCPPNGRELKFQVVVVAGEVVRKVADLTADPPHLVE